MANDRPADATLVRELEVSLRTRRFNQVVVFSGAVLAIRALVSMVNHVWLTGWLLLAGLLAMGVCAWTYRRGEHAKATVALLSGLICMITVLIWSSEGLYDAAMMAYPVILLMGGLLLRRRHFLGLCLLMLAAIGAVAIGSLAGWHARFVPGTVPARLADSLVILLVAGLAVWVVASDLQEMLQLFKGEVASVQQSQAGLQLKEQKLQLIFDASPTAMAVLDASAATRLALGSDSELPFLDVNDAWESSFRCRREEVVHSIGGSSFWERQDERQRCIDRLRQDRYIDGFEMTAVRYDGSHFLASLSARLANVGEDLMLIIAVEDITERRRIENEVRDLNAGLESRVAQRTEDLLRSNRELASTMENLHAAQGELVKAEKMAALGSLVAGVAHELNTPIGNGLMAVTTLRNQLDEFRQATAGGALRRTSLDAFLANVETATTIAVRGLERSAHLVNSFKQVAVDQSSAQRRQFRLAELIDQVLMVLHPIIGETPYRVELSVPESLALDSFPGALEQVLTHLINNAILHGFAGRDHGRISIRAEATADDKIRLCVCDDGQGIEENMQSRIFDPFFTTRLGQGSSGLGLHIAHNAVTEILGGRLTVVSQFGEGCEFVLDLPCVATAD